MSKKKRKANSSPQQHEAFAAAGRRLSEFLGTPVQVAIGSRTNGGVSHFYSNKGVLKLGATHKQALEIEISSIEEENDQLLHYLFRKTIGG